MQGEGETEEREMKWDGDGEDTNTAHYSSSKQPPSSASGASWWRDRGRATIHNTGSRKEDQGWGSLMTTVQQAHTQQRHVCGQLQTATSGWGESKEVGVGGGGWGKDTTL